MIKHFVPIALASLCLSQNARGQENNPLIISGRILEEAGKISDSGQYKKALALYQRIDRNDTNYIRALDGISSCYYEDSQFNASIEYAKKALALGSGPELEPALYNYYGNALNEMDSSEQALQIYDSAIRKYPAYSLLYLNKGSALIRLKRYAEAEAVFKEALLIDPYSYSSHYKLGYCALRQGKEIPAFLSFMGYLLLDPEGKFQSNCISWMNAIARNMDTIQSLISRRTEEPDENYQLLEQIVQSKIALDKNYTPLLKLDDPISRQIQVIFEKTEYQQADNDFWMQYYVPFFKSVFTGNRFECFIHRIFLAVNLPIIQDYVKKHKKELSDLTEDLVGYLNLILTTRELNYEKRQQDSTIWSRSHGSLTGHGLYRKQEEKRTGPWTFYYGPGNIKGKGSYTSDGNREGDFTWYLFNGRLNGKEFYHNGKQEGEETYYFSNGEHSTHSWYKNDSLEGESTYYYWVGTRHTVTHYHAGKEEGPKITFNNNGDSSLVENYKAGVLNGAVRSWSKYRTPEVIASYADGNLDGAYKKYYPNGHLSAQGNYKAGKQEGEWKSWYPNGQLKTVTSFRNDMAEGEHSEYYDNGVLYTTYDLKSGKIVGDIRYFDEDAKPYATLHYTDGVLQKAQYFDKSGRLAGESARDGKKKTIDLVQYLPDGSKRAQATFNDKGDVVGTQTFYYPSGKLSGTEAYQDGGQEGPAISYYTNGNKRTETSYAAGKMDGYHKSWYRHGHLQEEGWYKEGDAQGYWLDYNEMGDLTDSIYYMNDAINGYKTSFAPDGRKTFELKYHSGWLTEFVQYDTTGKELSHFSSPTGTGKLRLVYPNGQPRLEAEYRRSKFAGPHTEWYFDGKPSEISHYTRGLQDSSYTVWFHSGKPNIEGQYACGEKTGLWKYHYTNGALSQTETYVQGELNGPQIQYFENGKVETVTMFKDGKKEGPAKEYDLDGTLLYQMTYQHDNPVAYSYLDSRDSLLPDIPIPLQSGKIKTYFPNGKPSAEFDYKDGLFNGEKHLYHTNGQLRSFIHWDNGAAEGENVVYYPNGRIKISGNYVHDNLHGFYREYNDKGILTAEWSYYCGVPHGTSRKFDDDGRLLETDQYYYGILLSIKK